MTIYLIDRSDITSISKIEAQQPHLDIGQVRLKIEKGGLTANNVTYAILGERFNYWDFFPHKDGGILPMWGYATVEESTISEMSVGDRYYGYFPMASELIVRPVKINEYGFVDGTTHRQGLPPVYNYYENVKNNGINDDLENQYMIYQPLFATSFLLAHYFVDNQCFNAGEVFITSASSKTALAFAFVLSKMDRTIRLNGITSQGNISFCESTGLYDSLTDYGKLDSVTTESGVIVDFAGNSQMLKQLQHQLIPALNKSITMGLSHWDQTTPFQSMPFQSELFFAPDHAVRKQKEWGGKEFKFKINKELLPFLQESKAWNEYHTSKNILESYFELVNGNIQANQCLIIEI